MADASTNEDIKFDAEVVVIVPHMSHYHSARLRAAKAIIDALTVIDISLAPDFRGILAEEEHQVNVVKLAKVAGIPFQVNDTKHVWTPLQQLLDRLAPDIITVSGWASTASFVAIDWAKRNQCGLVMLSESQFRDARRQPWRETIKANVIRLCDAAVVGGRQHLDYMISLGMPRERIFLGYDVVDNNHFGSGSDSARCDRGTIRAQLNLPNRYLLASARFIPKKNLPRLILAYARAAKGATDPPNLVILGDGPERSTIEDVIAKCDISHKVVLTGFMDYDVLPAIYGLAAGFVHVPTSEQWGLVINEAAAAGLPLLISRECGAADELLREGLNGFLVDPYDIDDIAVGITKLTELSNERRKCMGVLSRRLVAPWGPERFGTGLTGACAAAMARTRSGYSLHHRALLRLLSRQNISTVA